MTGSVAIPIPLFFRDFTPEPARKESKEHVFGPVTPPRPRYDVPRWREMISIVERRRAIEARQGAPRMSSPAGGAAPSYDEQIERARVIQRRADRNLIIGTGLIGTMILGLFGLPFFIYGLWQLYKAEREGLPVRPVMMTFVGYLVLVDGAMNTLGAMIDVLANHSLHRAHVHHGHRIGVRCGVLLAVQHAPGRRCLGTRREELTRSPTGWCSSPCGSRPPGAS